MKTLFSTQAFPSQVLAELSALQNYFASALELSPGCQHFVKHTWQRDAGSHGGGDRLTDEAGSFFNRASINISQVQYEDLPQRPLSSATALSSIIHPQHPLLPSVHLHVSYTALKNAAGYWRLMADLNPSHPNATDSELFCAALRTVAGTNFAHGCEQGDQYFYIPTLKRHRGVIHFYLENFKTEDPNADLSFAVHFAKTVISTYTRILQDRLKNLPEADVASQQRQLAYHTVYFFQVLTLDRGTTSGLLVHDENDVGILASLPARVDKQLMVSWLAIMPTPQEHLLRGILQVIPDSGEIQDAEKKALAAVLRAHYAKYPEALLLQARGCNARSTHQKKAKIQKLEVK